MTKEKISKEIKECEERLAKLREEMNKPEYGGKRWKPEADDTYYCLSADGSVNSHIFFSPYDLNAYLSGNCFKTREEAEFERERRKVISELSDFAEGDDAAWDGRQHWFIYYNTASILKIVSCAARVAMKTGEIHFPSEKAAKAAIKAVGEERIKKYYLGVKE